MNRIRSALIGALLLPLSVPVRALDAQARSPVNDLLSQAADADFIKTDEGQRRMAESLAEGVSRYVAPTRQVSPRKSN